MQATVHEFDQDARCGRVVTDDGLLIPFGAQAFAASGLRLLRPGQRLTVEVTESHGARLVHALRLGNVGTPGGQSLPWLRS